VTVVVSKVGNTGDVKEVVSDSKESHKASSSGDASDGLAGVVMG
jgi:hypothetical protein